MDQEQQMDSDDEPRSVTFHYIKSNFFRVIHADGAWGGITPRGNLQVSFWNERAPIPKQLTQEIDAGNRLGEEIGRKSRQGIVREVEAEIVMSLECAEVFLEWFDGKVRELRQAVSGPQSDSDEKDEQ